MSQLKKVIFCIIFFFFKYISLFSMYSFFYNFVFCVHMCLALSKVLEAEIRFWLRACAWFVYGINTIRACYGTLSITLS